MENQKNTSSNFGSKGWLMIVIAGIFFYFYSGMCTDGLNTIVSSFAQTHNVDEAALLGITTPASWFGLLGAVVWSFFIDRKSIRLGALCTGILGGVSFMLYALVSTVTGFGIVTAFVNFMGMGYCWTVANALMASWFPKKKGLALGWATMGQNLASATFVPLLMFFVAKTNFFNSFYIMGAILALGGIIAFILIRDNPEELGCAPDNGSFTKEEIEASLKEAREYKSPWTPKKLLTNKQVWQIGIGYGILIIVTVSLISRMIPRLIMAGWEPPKAIASMSVCAIIGLFGSYLTGWLDQKFGTKKASVMYALWYFVGLVLCAIPTNNEIVLYLTIFFTGIGIGGIGNLFPSMTATVFGRFDFVRAMGVLNPITNIVRSFAFIILAFSLKQTGAYNLSYGIIAALDLFAILLILRIDDNCIGK